MKDVSYKLLWDPVNKKVRYEHYDYSDKPLRSILQKAFENGYEQIIFTKKTIENALKKSIEKDNVYLKNMKFIESIDKNESEEIDRIISNINNYPAKYKYYIDKLLEEIQWIIDENSIDVKSFEIIIKEDVVVKLEIFCNGIIFISNSNYLNSITEYFLDDVLEEEYI